MSKTSELDLCIDELRHAAQSLCMAADSLAALFSGADDELEASTPPKPPATPPITLEQVRAVLASKSQDGFTAEVRALLQKHGAPKLSEIAPDRYAALLADAEALGHG